MAEQNLETALKKAKYADDRSRKTLEGEYEYEFVLDKKRNKLKD